MPWQGALVQHGVLWSITEFTQAGCLLLWVSGQRQHTWYCVEQHLPAVCCWKWPQYGQQCLVQLAYTTCAQQYAVDLTTQSVSTFNTELLS